MVDIWRRHAVGRGANRFTNVRLTPNVKESAVAFFRLQERTDLGLDDLMKQSFAQYSTQWCAATFKVPWPPFTVAVGPGTRKRISHSFRPKQKQTAADIVRHASEIAETMVAAVGKQGALDLLTEWPEDGTLRKCIEEIVIARIKG